MLTYLYTAVFLLVFFSPLHAQNKIIKAIENGDTTSIATYLGEGGDLESTINTNIGYEKRNVSVSLLQFSILERERELAYFLIKKRRQAADSIRFLSRGLAAAVESGDTLLARTLAELGADVNYTDELAAGETTLLFAYENNREIFNILRKYSPDFNKRNTAGLAPIHLAVINKNKTLLDLLLSEGADLNALTSEGESALLLSCRNYNHDMFRFLLMEGAQTGISKKPEPYAMMNEMDNETDPDVIRKFVEPGRVMSHGFNQYTTPLLEAIHYGDSTKIENFIHHGADVNARDSVGRTPLHFATEFTYSEVMEILLLRGAFVNARDNAGITALHIAVQEKNYDAVQLLLRYNADKNIKDQHGLTARDYAGKKLIPLFDSQE